MGDLYVLLLLVRAQQMETLRVFLTLLLDSDPCDREVCGNATGLLAESFVWCFLQFLRKMFVLAFAK